MPLKINLLQFNMSGLSIIRKYSLSSTNDYLKELVNGNEQEEGKVVIAENQVDGRGQGANKWESESGKNLTFSLLLKPTFIEAGDMFLISKAVSLGIVTCLNEMANDFTIKWPNDIYWQDKKVCGILIENQLLGCCLSYSFIGVGVNVNQKAFISDAPNPISLCEIVGEEIDLDTCLEKLLTSINSYYEKLRNDDSSKLSSEYFKYLYRKEGFYKYRADGEIFEAKIDAVKDDGLLNLKTKSGELKAFYFKEVDFVL